MLCSAECDGNNNPKLTRIIHFYCSYHESGGINETLQWEKELWFKSKRWERGWLLLSRRCDDLISHSKGVWLNGFLSVAKVIAELAASPSLTIIVESPGCWNLLALLQQLGFKRRKKPTVVSLELFFHLSKVHVCLLASSPVSAATDCNAWGKKKGPESLRTIKITAGLEEVAMRGTRMKCSSRIKSWPGVNPAALGQEQI